MTSQTSVIIPVKGEAQYLYETLHSIQKNTILPEEILIINDGIGETTLKTLRKLSNKIKIKIIPNQGHGLVDALNTGIEYSSHELILRIDADDAMTSNRIEIQSDIMKQDRTLVLLGTQCLLIDASGNLIGKTLYPTGVLNNSWIFKGSCQLAHPSIIMRRSAVLKAGGYRKIFKSNEVDIAEDFDLWLRMAKLGKIRNLNSCLTKYRQHPGQISSNFEMAQILATMYISAVNSTDAEITQCELITKPKLEFSDFRQYKKIIYSQKNLLIRIQNFFLLNRLLSQAQNNSTYAFLFGVFTKIIRMIFRLQSKCVSK